MNTNEVIIQLDFPIELNGLAVNEIAMRRPTVGDRLSADNSNKADSEFSKEVLFIANLCGAAPREFNSLDLKDYNKFTEKLSNFLS